MAQLTTALALMSVIWAGAAVADKFSPKLYFCADTPDTLITVSDAIHAAIYFRDLRQGVKALNVDACKGLRMQTILQVAKIDDAEIRKTSISALSFAQLGRQMQINELEPRYAGDIDFLLQAALTCTLAGEERGCLKDTINALPEPFLASSPVLCDFAVNPTVPLAATEKLESAPLVCGSGVTGIERDVLQKDWLVRASYWGLISKSDFGTVPSNDTGAKAE